MGDISADRLMGRITAGDGDPETLTPENVRTIINVADGAEVNVQSDWNQTTTTADDYIKNKPSIPTDTNTTYDLTCTQTASGLNNTDDDDPYLWLNASSGDDDAVQITGGTNVTVTRNSATQLTISSTGAPTTSTVSLSGTSTQTISTIALSAASCSEFTIHLTHGSNVHACKLLVMDDGSSAYCVEYGVMYSSSSLGAFSCSTSGSNILVRCTPTNSGATGVRFITQQVI